MLVDRAVQLKINLKKGEELEESLISTFSNLTLLLEHLNMEGDEEQRAEEVRLANKVTTEIEKYKGKVEEFQHEYRSTLTFANQEDRIPAQTIPKILVEIHRWIEDTQESTIISSQTKRAGKTPWKLS